jgi:hypothetical protein
MVTISNVMGLTSPNAQLLILKILNSSTLHQVVYVYYNDMATGQVYLLLLQLEIVSIVRGREVLSNNYHNATLVYTINKPANATKELVVDVPLLPGVLKFGSQNVVTLLLKSIIMQTSDTCNTGALEGSITLFSLSRRLLLIPTTGQMVLLLALILLECKQD